MPVTVTATGRSSASSGREFLERTDLTNRYVPVDAADGQPRHCGGCGAEFTALTGAKAMICEGWPLAIGIGEAPLQAVSEIHGRMLEPDVGFSRAVKLKVLVALSRRVEHADGLAADLPDPGRRVVEIEADGEVEGVALVFRA